MRYFATTTPSRRISAARIYSASKVLVRRAQTQHTSAGRKIGRMVRLLGIDADDRLTVWLIAQNAWHNVLRVDDRRSAATSR